MTNQKYLTIEDIFTHFFTIYNSVKSEHLKAVFGNISDEEITVLDNLFIDVFGERIVTKRLTKIYNSEGETSTTIRAINAIDLLCYDNWITLKSNLVRISDFDIEKPYKDTTTRELERDNNSITQNSENAFDDVENDSNTDKSDTSISENVNETIAKAYSGNKTAIENACALIDFTRQYDFVKIVLTDIANNVSLSVY